jgi:serine/threonine-protein kinase
MGVVQICTDSILERQVAIKQIQTGTQERRIKDELQGLLRMRSKHVVQVYDVLISGGNELSIVQEFIDGSDLFQSFALPTDRVEFCKEIWQIASGIADIHEAGVVHRDIKPNNMKTDGEGIIKIFDFGLAREEGPAASTMGFVGTRGFAAPELYRDVVQFTQAVDVYAFGATAFYLGSGDLVPEMVAVPPTQCPPGMFANLGLGLAAHLACLLDACLSVNPAHRPPMPVVRDLLAKHLLHGLHQALVVFEGAPSHLGSTNRTVDLNLPGVGQVTIGYDDLDFTVRSVSGEVLINNAEVAAGFVIPGSCVVSLGLKDRRANERKFITFDVSQPEIVL